ncbi:hypothetical protein PG985_007884 [Apiospora marii]|uniref:Uncharacterized protein n=1 Tax=Apiospora marii TaxID=335849 RepID=A0ABR1R8X6_9PEZI
MPSPPCQQQRALGNRAVHHADREAAQGDVRDEIPPGVTKQDLQRTFVNSAMPYRPSFSMPRTPNDEVFCLRSSRALPAHRDMPHISLPVSLFPTQSIDETLELAAEAVDKPLQSGRVNALATMKPLYVPPSPAAPAEVGSPNPASVPQGHQPSSPPLPRRLPPEWATPQLPSMAPKPRNVPDTSQAVVVGSVDDRS